MRTFKFTIILTALLCFITGATALGQDNPYKIDNECYEAFRLANLYRGQDSCLVYVQTLRETAIKKGDSKAETLSYVMALQHALRIGEENAINESAEEVKDVAMRTGYMQYYYYAFSSRVTYLLNRGSLFSALVLAEEMIGLAQKNNDAFGIWEGYKCMGNIYYSGGDRLKAREFRRKAIDYSVNVPEQTMARVCMDMAETFDERDSVKFFMDMMGRNLKTAYDSTMYAARMAKFHAVAGEGAEFKKFYSDYKNHVKSSGQNPIPQEEILELELFDLISLGKLDEAVKKSRSLSNNNTRLIFLEQIALIRGDQAAAYGYAKKRIAHLESVYRDDQVKEMGEIEMNLKMRNAAISAGKDSIRDAQMKAREKTNNYTVFMMGILLVLALLIIISLTLYYYQKKLLQEKSEKEEAQRILEEEKTKAEHSSAMKSMYLQNMSHEIRTPLNAIIGFSQLLAMPDDFVSAEEKTKYLEYISNSANILNMHVDDILNVSDIESGNYIVNNERCKINEVCRFSMKSVEYRVQPGVNLYFTTDLSEDTYSITDGRRIQQVIINFLSNACKHTFEGEIHVHSSLTDDGKYVSVSVTDTGEGIQGENRTDIFNRFVKLDSMKEGTGIGLNICKGIAKRLHGRVYLDPDYTTGCKFVFLFPFQQD